MVGPNHGPPSGVVESFGGRNFGVDKLSPLAKIEFRGYKLSRMGSILVLFFTFVQIFVDFWQDFATLA